MVLVEHEVGTCLLPEEHKVPVMAKERIFFKVRVSIAVDLDEEVPYDLL